MNRFSYHNKVASCDLDQELADMLYAISETSKRIADKIKQTTDEKL